MKPLAGDIRMNCDTCLYRTPLPGHHHRLGATRMPHHHPDDGCTGAAIYTQTTARNNQWQETMTWTFRPGTAVRCAVDVYVPAANGNGRAHYDVYGPDPISFPYRIGETDVDQPAHRGQWVGLGDWSAPAGVLQVRLTDRTARDGTSYRVAASAARASCT